MRLLILLSLVFSSCSTVAPHRANNGNWGTIVGPIKTEWGKARDMRLLDDVKYIAPDKTEWIAKAGEKIDGASIPKTFWSILGGPYEGAYRDASVLHDVECDRREKPWQDVHYMFYTAMRSAGVSERQAKIMYAAVYRFGPRWKVVNDKVVSIPLAARREPTTTDVKKLERFVDNANPTIERIEVSEEIPGNPAP
jgi:hypothetical protein